MPRLILLSGPSCVGKSPLAHALGQFYPALAETLVAPVLYTSRAARPGERDGVDYHFRPRAVIEELRQDKGTIVLDVRRDLQALRMADLHAILDQGQDAFFEGNPYIATALMAAPALREIPVISAFMSPLSAEEVTSISAEDPANVAAIVTDVMRHKLLRRTQKQKGVLSAHDLEDIEARAGAAWQELGDAHRFQWVLPNHDGEDSDNWDAFYYLLGDARKSLLDFVALLTGQPPRWAERWEPDVMPTTR